MKYLILILGLVVLPSCSLQNTKIYSASQKADWHKIDLGSFELETPKGYKYKERQGIDSYVGQISNGTTTFEFDYGWYSMNKPLTPRELFEDTKTTLYRDEISEAFGSKLNPDSLFFEIQEKFIVKKVTPLGDGQFLAALELNGQQAQIQFEPFAKDADNEYFQYKMEEDQDDLYYKKLYLPKKLGQRERAGVYIEDLLNKEESPYGYDQLAFYTFDMNTTNQKELIEILKSVKMKKKPVKE